MTSCYTCIKEGVKKEIIGAIADENKQYHDMLLPNVEDNYHTVGIKLLSSFNWIRQLKHIKDLKWIMKIDDDIMVNFTRLDKYLTSENKNLPQKSSTGSWWGVLTIFPQTWNLGIGRSASINNRKTKCHEELDFSHEKINEM